MNEYLDDHRDAFVRPFECSGVSSFQRGAGGRREHALGRRLPEDTTSKFVINAVAECILQTRVVVQ